MALRMAYNLRRILTNDYKSSNICANLLESYNSYKESDMGIEILNRLLLDGRDVLDDEPNEPKFDRDLACKYAGKHRGSVRLSMGKFYTKEEWEKKRETLLKLSLP